LIDCLLSLVFVCVGFCSATPVLRSLWGPATHSFRPSSLGSAHLAQPTRRSPLGSAHSHSPLGLALSARPTRLHPLASATSVARPSRFVLGAAAPLGPLGSEPSVGPFGSDPSGSNSSDRFLDLVFGRSDLRAGGSWPLQSSAALGIGVLRHLSVHLVQPLCPACSRFHQSPRLASLRLGLLASVPSDRAPSDPTPRPLRSFRRGSLDSNHSTRTPRLGPLGSDPLGLASSDRSPRLGPPGIEILGSGPPRIRPPRIESDHSDSVPRLGPLGSATSGAARPALTSPAPSLRSVLRAAACAQSPQALHHCQFDARSFLRSAAWLRHSVLRAATGARSSRALRHSQVGARFFLRCAILALRLLMRSAALLGRSLPRTQLLGLLGSGRVGSDTLGSPSSDRSLSAWPPRIGLSDRFGPSRFGPSRHSLLLCLSSARPLGVCS